MQLLAPDTMPEIETGSLVKIKAPTYIGRYVHEVYLLERAKRHARTFSRCSKCSKYSKYSKWGMVSTKYLL